MIHYHDILGCTECGEINNLLCLGLSVAAGQVVTLIDSIQLYEVSYLLEN